MATGAMAGAGLASGFYEAQQAKRAAKLQGQGAMMSGYLQQAAAAGAQAEQRKALKRAREDYQPYMGAGREGISTYQDLLMGRRKDYRPFYESPDYKFAVEQGTKAVERGAAAKGGLFSGAQGKALTKFGQGLASQQYSTYMDRLLRMATMGQQATSHVSSLGMQAAGAIGQAGMQGMGALGQGIEGATGARAAAMINAAEKRTSGIGFGMSALGGMGGMGGGAGAGGAASVAAPMGGGAAAPAVQQPVFTPYQTPVVQNAPTGYDFGGMRQIG